MSDGTMLRNLVRKRDRAALASLMVDGSAPYASMVMTATDPAGNILMLLSDLAVHSRNIAANGSVSLLYEDEFGAHDPLLGLRVTLQATICKTDDAVHKERYLNRHPAAAEFVDFGDFNFYLAQVNKVHFVAGFGQIRWVDKAEYLLAESQYAPMIAIEAEIIRHMNEDHGDAVELIAARLAGKQGGDWILSGLDAEGYDLRCGFDSARLRFENPVSDAREIHKEFIQAANKARSIS